MHQNWSKLIRTAVHWALFIITLLYLVTGLGITQYHIVESLTFGLLTKNVAFRVHDSLLIPFIALLVLHVIMKPAERLYSRLKHNTEPSATANDM
jgi:cytochrome b subunit of formate dehydrogenase